MKLTNTTWISVDGVMQGSVRPKRIDEAVSSAAGGRCRMPTPRSKRRSKRSTQGRRVPVAWTYDVFAGSWGTVPPMKDSAVGEALNTKPKRVSTTLSDPEWADTTVLSGDLAAAIGKLKAEGEGQLLVPGSRTLTRWLLEHDLFDEINLFTAPVLVGQGTRLFPTPGWTSRSS